MNKDDMIGNSTGYHTRMFGKSVPTGKDDCRVIVLQHGWLGDTIMTLPLLAALPKHWYKTFVGRLPQAALTRCYMDEVIDCETIDIEYDRFDLCINLIYDQDTAIANAILGAGVPTVIEPACFIKVDLNVGSMMLSALEPIGITNFDVVPRLPVKTTKRNRTIAFHTSSNADNKNWNIDNWLLLVKALKVYYDLLIVCGPKDAKATEYILNNYSHPLDKNRMDVLCNVSLSELSERLSECALFIGHDTGVTHLATAVGTPTIALFGGTNPRVWGPRGTNISFVTSSTLENIDNNAFTFSPMDNITVDMVYDHVLKRLS